MEPYVATSQSIFIQLLPHTFLQPYKSSSKKRVQQLPKFMILLEGCGSQSYIKIINSMKLLEMRIYLFKISN